MVVNRNKQKKFKHPATPHDKQQRKQRVLSQGTPSVTRRISDAVVIKEGNPFFLALPDGDVPLETGHGFGLYYNDCRYLNGYELHIASKKATTLVSNADRGYMGIFELTNGDIRLRNKTVIPKEAIGVKWTRRIDGGRLMLHDILSFQNFSLSKITFPITLTFRAGFEDIFAVRELLNERPGKIHASKWENGALRFSYDGSDGLFRTLVIYFWPKPSRTGRNAAHFEINLAARQTREISVCILIGEAKARKKAEGITRPDFDVHTVKVNPEPWFEEWLRKHTAMESNSLLLNEILDRSLRDLLTLRSNIGEESFFAAGIPWFATLFGRDSIITAIQTLAFNPDLAAETLRLLAKYQGQKVDDWKDEQPGKILHELRIGELARTGEIPHTPYYGTIDATPLFLILFGQYAAWTGDLELFQELKSNVEAAIGWMARFGDIDQDGYIEYQSASQKGLINQGWKDSGDAIINADGSLAEPPIALVEIQGYAYMAKLLIAGLFARIGENTRAEKLRNEANELRKRFNQDFWIEKIGTYALALEANKKAAAVVSSNPGQVLWSGIADNEKAKKTVERLMKEDMFSGWGIRTLSEKEARYNPVGYHLGTVWPHDNSIIAAGFHRYGFHQEAQKILSAMMEAAMEFGGYRLPELFAGFNRKDYSIPVHYPVACHPQAWAAGSVPFMLATLLGLHPDAFGHSLRIERPILPEFVEHLTVRRLRVADAEVDLQFDAGPDFYAKVQVLEVRGQLDIQIED